MRGRRIAVAKRRLDQKLHVGQHFRPFADLGRLCLEFGNHLLFFGGSPGLVGGNPKPLLVQFHFKEWQELGLDDSTKPLKQALESASGCAWSSASESPIRPRPMNAK